MARCPAMVVVLIALSGCGGNPQNQARPATRTEPAKALVEPAKPIASKSYKLTGVVREIDPLTGQVMIRHDEIPGFMKAMTMPFDLKGKAVLGDLFVGDEVEGTLVVKAEDIELNDLVITRPAEPAALNFGPNGLMIKAKPAVLMPGEDVPDLKVTLQDGKAAKLSDYRGKLVLLTFIYTKCPLPNFCPLMDQKFAELAIRFRGTSRADQVRLLSVSFDPEHDTPEALAKHAKLRGAKMPLWTFAVASHEELGKFGPNIGLVYGPGEKEIMHNLTTALIGADGKLIRLDYGTAGGTWAVDDMMGTILKSFQVESETKK
ncbi:MAG: SCO family protein [Planctomycetota bacterium]|nr:SCO family protein [Planctomycetota bacterium]